MHGKERLQRKLDNYSIFHKYMEKALEKGEEFHEMRDVIARYDTLTATHEVIWRIILQCNGQGGIVGNKSLE